MSYIHELQSVVQRATPLLLAFTERRIDERPGPDKWSPREIIGHLVDSASTNHQRFVRAQLHEDLIFPGYDQEAWVRLQPYRDAPWADLVTLWSTFNLHLARLMAATPEETRRRLRHRHTLHEIAWRPVPVNEPATLEYFMNDYVEHLKHHLRQVLGEKWEGLPVS